jgi:predicted secreted protein
MARPRGTADDRRRRVQTLQTKLQDERGGRVVFLSHCLLNENTRYLGGAFRSGAVEEVVDVYLRAGTGIHQMPCPERVVWGGVLKRWLLLLYGRRWLTPLVPLVLPGLRSFVTARYRLLARRVARQVGDYQRSGFDVVGVVGVDASPTCGVMTTLDLASSLEALMACPLARMDRRFMNETVVANSVRPGRGLFTQALDDSLARRGCCVPLLAHDLRSEIPGSSIAAGPKPAGVLGAS